MRVIWYTSVPKLGMAIGHGSITMLPVCLFQSNPLSAARVDCRTELACSADREYQYKQQASRFFYCLHNVDLLLAAPKYHQIDGDLEWMWLQLQGCRCMPHPISLLCPETYMWRSGAQSFQVNN